MSSDSSAGVKKTKAPKRAPSSEGDKKRKKTSSSSSSSSGDEGTRKHRKEKKKRKRKEGSSEDERRRRKEKKKAKKLRKKMKKRLREKERGKKKEPEEEEEEDEGTVEIPISLMSKTMAPMTKEQWEKEQSVVRKVYDESTGRHRLIKGDGEVIEEMVSRDRHKAINEDATRGDGNFFQKNVLKR